MSSDDVCSFCLGGSTEIPPFGTLNDAQNLFRPCSTCSLIVHRKCLIEWFNTIPFENLTMVYAKCIHDAVKDLPRSTVTEDPADNVTDTEDLNPDGETAGVPAQNTNNGFLTFTIPEGIIGGIVSGVTELSLSIQGMNAAGLTGFLDNPNILSQQDLPFESNQTNITSTPTNTGNAADGLQLTNVIAEIKDHNHDPEKCNNKTVILAFVACPQCKKSIVFQIDRPQTLVLREAMATVAIRIVQYGGMTLGVFSAITGIILTGYLGLTAVGINSMRSIIPSSILAPLLMKKPFKVISRQPSIPDPALNWKEDGLLGVILQGARYLYRMANGINLAPNVPQQYNSIADNIDNLQDAVIEGVVDPSIFNKIPTLPIIMYRMRGSSLLECLFTKEKWPDNLSKIGTELVVSLYLSSWGSLKLGSLLARCSWSDLIAWPFWKNVFLRDPDYILGTLMPLRWLYDFWFRLVVNRIHFRLTLKTVPRAIYNKFRNALTLELIALQMGGIDLDGYLRLTQSTPISWKNEFMYKILLAYKYNILRLKYWYYETLAVLAMDYSRTMSNQSLIVKSIITTAWPFVSSYIGRLIFRFLTTKFSAKLTGVSRANLLLLSNIIGLCVAVGIKDLANLYDAYTASHQINDVQIMTWTTNSSSPAESNSTLNETHDLAGFPGLFPG